MGTKERREREREELRAKILDAARELFAELGYEAVTMRKIAERIEYSPTAIYLHFKDKRAVIQELCDHDFLVLAKKLQRIARIEEPLERLRAAGVAYVDFALEHPNHYRLMFMQSHPEVVEESDECAIRKGNPEEDAYAFLHGTVIEAIGAKCFRPEVTDADLVAQSLWAAVHGVASLHIALGGDDWVTWRPAKKTAKFLIDAMLDGLVNLKGTKE